MSEGAAPRQLALDLGHRPAFGREDFLVAPGNAEAVGWIDRWPAWPAYALALYGPPGCGKSHLAQVFALRARARVLQPAEVTHESVGATVEAARAFVIEDGPACDERALFHLLNAAREAEAHLLLVAREPPARWATRLADLRSRLAALPAARIAPPDDAMMDAVLIKLFADRQLAVAPDVVAYVGRRLGRTFAAMRDFVARADAESLAGRRALTIPFVKSLLGED